MLPQPMMPIEVFLFIRVSYIHTVECATIIHVLWHNESFDLHMVRQDLVASFITVSNVADLLTFSYEVISADMYLSVSVQYPSETFSSLCSEVAPCDGQKR